MKLTMTGLLACSLRDNVQLDLSDHHPPSALIFQMKLIAKHLGEGADGTINKAAPFDWSFKGVCGFLDYGL